MTDQPFESSPLAPVPPALGPRRRGALGEDPREVLLVLLLTLVVCLLYFANASVPSLDTVDLESALPLESALQLDPRSAEVLAAGLLGLFLLGVVAALFLLHRLLHGQVRSAYAAREMAESSTDDDEHVDVVEGVEGVEVRRDRRLPYLETTVLFLIAAILVGAGVNWWVVSTGRRWLHLAQGLTLVVLFWPLARARSGRDLRRAMGWHFGHGWLREMACGVFAYFAALPVLAVGLGLTLLVTRITGQSPHHPVVDWLRDAGTGELVVVGLLAVVWAPLVEESLFRGAFYHYLRGRLGIWSTVLVTSLVFAAIHPQGLAGIPFLATLAAVLAWTREWRDSIVASVTLHMVHNGLATALLVVLLS